MLSNEIDKKIKRGKESWNFFYSILGLLLAIASIIISFMPFDLFYKSMVFIAILLFLILICLLNSWWQNKLVGLKIKLEDGWKKI